MATQREAYYCLVQYFKNQAEFNSTLQGKGLNYVCVPNSYCKGSLAWYEASVGSRHTHCSHTKALTRFTYYVTQLRFIFLS